MFDAQPAAKRVGTVAAKRATVVKGRSMAVSKIKGLTVAGDP